MSIDIERLKVDPSYWDECGAGDDVTHYCPVAKLFYNDSYYPIAPCCIPRPQPASVEWESGFPEVGEKVEVWVSNAGYWAEVSVLAVDVDTVVWRNGSDRISYIGTHIDNARPIRTTEQRQRDELALLIEDSAAYGYDYTAAAILSRYNLEPKP